MGRNRDEDRDKARNRGKGHWPETDTLADLGTRTVK